MNALHSGDERPGAGKVKERGTILCVDDDSTVLRALRTVLENAIGSEMDLEFAEGGEEALEIADELAARGEPLVLVISDFMMPGLRGDELLVRLHERSPATMKILLTGQSDLSGVKRAINEADLYRFLEKPFNNEDIVLTVRSAIRAYQQGRDLIRRNEELQRMNAELESIVQARTQELVEKNRELEVLSVTDRLTGLYNRRKLDEIIDEELALFRRYGSHFAIVMLDIDHFKQVNDTLGHQAGDAVLAELAKLVGERTRQVDVLARYGGEEFVVIFRRAPPGSFLAAAEKLRAAIAEHDFPHVGHLTASFGVAHCREGDDAPTLLARADAALYRAKNAGRNRVEDAQ
jgi:diguanylate cyclase (GGDEF)-like protein